MCNFAADMKKTKETIAALLLIALAPNAAFAATNCGVKGYNGMKEIIGTKVTEEGITESMVAEKEVAANKVSLNKTTEKNAFKNNKVIGTKAKDNRITLSGNGLFADSSRVFDIDEVVVAAQPKEQYRLRLQPLSSTSLGARQLTSLHATDLRQLSAFVPSFVMPEYGSRYTSAMYVRGIGSSTKPTVWTCFAVPKVPSTARTLRADWLRSTPKTRSHIKAPTCILASAPACGVMPSWHIMPSLAIAPPFRWQLSIMVRTASCATPSQASVPTTAMRQAHVCASCFVPPRASLPTS